MLHSVRQGAKGYYFRKLARYLEPGEYRRVKALRERTQPQVSTPECLFLRWAIRKLRAETVVEIGSYCGSSTVIMADLLQQRGRGRVYAIDLFSLAAKTGKGHPGEYWHVFDRLMEPYGGWFEKIEADSTTLQWERPIDLLFIDGDHSEAGVTADLTKWTPLVRVGGRVPARLPRCPRT